VPSTTRKNKIYEQAIFIVLQPKFSTDEFEMDRNYGKNCVLVSIYINLNLVTNFSSY